jgi:hypothetical protein
MGRGGRVDIGGGPACGLPTGLTPGLDSGCWVGGPTGFIAGRDGGWAIGCVTGRTGGSPERLPGGID